MVAFPLHEKGNPGPTWLSAAEAANCFRDAGEPESAVTYYELALSHSPHDVSTLLDLGDTLLDLAKFDTASIAYGGVLESGDARSIAWASASLAFIRDLSNEGTRCALEMAPDGPRRKELGRYFDYARDELPPILDRPIRVVVNQVAVLANLPQKPRDGEHLSLSTPISRSLAWVFREEPTGAELAGLGRLCCRFCTGGGEA